ncbi:hypothetical protein HYH03_006319 [Edaphochlamys debaryana]|uniref:Flagellar associated protein n=1 Tax=Edaphochlamys debaryana TaxID=47281 RepID=A0A835Y5V6_9CHLO|nr:hypothetical protein HYH03_006319 [Edaphochlamys debaryana]|eukprot:KAG2495719.1 hypothetical protein HYH03_006319 [Edaphochlamys debaryana]
MAVHESQHPFVKNPWGQGRPGGRSMFGKQADSKKQSFPSYTMLGSREGREKVFLSQAHVEADRKCREGPGHIYDLPSAMQRQVDARKESAPLHSFAHSERLKETVNTNPGPGVYSPVITSMGEQACSPNRSPSRVPFGTSDREAAKNLYLSSGHVTAKRGTLGAPPGQYEVPGALGRQPLSAKPSSPAFSLSRTDRLKEKYEAMSRTMPAVGSYETWNSIGKQTLSLSRTMPAFGFGSSSRETEEKRFLTTTHAKMHQGKYSPNNYHHQLPENITSFGRQPLSRKANVPAYGFGSQPRLTFKSSTTPGPGAYEN